MHSCRLSVNNASALSAYWVIVPWCKHTSKPPITRSQFWRATHIPHTGTGRSFHGVNKGNDCGETGRGQLASALSHRRYTRHTCSLRDKTRLEYRPHFVITIYQCEQSRLIASLTESDYCWLLSHSVSAETVFADTSVQWMKRSTGNDVRFL